jgi:hypothetical protein
MNNNTQLQIILSNSIIATVLPAIAQLDLPNWWLAGGAVRNTVWRSLFGQECDLFVKDFDIAKSTLKTQFPEQEFDVKNQASFGNWRAGNMIFNSTEDGITNWLHTATAVGVRMTKQGEWQFFTPYGLDDLFKGIIRPTPIHINNPDADQKAAVFLQKCPCLRLGKDEL